jgi:hypothetical protein
MVAAVAPAAPRFTEVTVERKLRFNLHPGQQQAFWSNKRFILVLAGLQSGKTATGPPWLLEEMKERGPGDYLVCSPTFTLLELKALPEFKRLFETMLGLGTYKSSPIREFTLSKAGEIKLWGAVQDIPTRVLFAHAQDPDSIESGTYKGAWLDEAGQKKFKRDSWVSVQGRLSIHEGRCLFTTTAYVLGWLKQEIYDPWLAAERNHPEIEVVSFESTMNPVFPRAEFERMRRILPAWQFDMRYRGRFTRPAGMIYDCWIDEPGPESNVIPWFRIPDEWDRFLGLDFGGVNTAGLFVARELADDGTPTGRYIGYREYHAGGRTATEHVTEIKHGEPRTPTAIGGSKSEGQWRNEFAAAGLGVWEPPVSEVEVGISRMYGAIQTRQFVILDKGCEGFRDQVTSYGRELDEKGEPTEKIEDKEIYHLADCGRYLLSFLFQGDASGGLI